MDAKSIPSAPQKGLCGAQLLTMMFDTFLDALSSFTGCQKIDTSLPTDSNECPTIFTDRSTAGGAGAKKCFEGMQAVMTNRCKNYQQMMYIGYIGFFGAIFCLIMIFISCMMYFIASVRRFGGFALGLQALGTACSALACGIWGFKTHAIFTSFAEDSTIPWPSLNLYWGWMLCIFAMVLNLALAAMQIIPAVEDYDPDMEKDEADKSRMNRVKLMYFDKVRERDGMKRAAKLKAMQNVAETKARADSGGEK